MEENKIEEAAEKYMKSDELRYSQDPCDGDVKDAFVAGAKWAIENKLHDINAELPNNGEYGIGTKELRVGDIVTYFGKTVTVKAINDSGEVEITSNDNDNSIVYISNLQSISLTDKLLEKIGFKCKYTVPIYEYDDCQYDLMHNSFQSLSCDKNNIKYLHQLQHELYDSGIEVKIEL